MTHRYSDRSIKKLTRDIEAVLEKHAHERPRVAAGESVAALFELLAQKAVDWGRPDLTHVWSMQTKLGNQLRFAMDRYLEDQLDENWYWVGPDGEKHYASAADEQLHAPAKIDGVKQ
jgi:hypothetical protein